MTGVLKTLSTQKKIFPFGVCFNTYCNTYCLMPVVAYVRKSCALCISECAGIHARIIIRIMLVFLLCEGETMIDTKCEKYKNLDCIAYQLLLVMARFSVRKKVTQ